MAEVIEHKIVERWWNGSFGDLHRQRLRLHRHVTDDGAEHWAVELDSTGEHLAYPCDNEQQAHDTIARLCQERPGDWRRVDAAARGEQD
jgi:hypothetical protein